MSRHDEVNKRRPMDARSDEARVNVLLAATVETLAKIEEFAEKWPSIPEARALHRRVARLRHDLLAWRRDLPLT